MSAVLTSFAQNLAMLTSGPETPTPTTTDPWLSWTAPASPPSFYTYKVNVNNFNGSQENWHYPNNGNGLPIGTTSVQYNKDGSANPNSPLIAGETYDWSVTVLDAGQNTATITGPNYTVPGGSPLSPVVTVSFNPTSIASGNSHACFQHQ